MCSERSDALKRDAQYYEDRSNLFVGAEAAELLDLAVRCREDAQWLRERPHEHLAQTTRAVAAEREAADDVAAPSRESAHRSEYDRLVEYELDLTLADEPEWMTRAYWQSPKELADEAAQRIAEDDLDDGLGL